MKKITILCLHLGVGGIEKYISSLSKMLEQNYKIEIISTYKTLDKPAFDFSDKVKIKYLINDRPYKEELKDSIKKLKLISIVKYLFKNAKLLMLKYSENIKIIKNINSDYIITTRDFHNKLVGKYAKDKIIKIATEHNHHNNNSRYIKKVVTSLKNIDYFVVVSEDLKEFYKNKIGDTKCLYIPNVIDNIYDKPKYNTNYNLVSVGRFSKEKAFEDLIEVIGIVKKDIPNIHLNLVGDGKLKNDITNKIESLDLKENIKLCGYLSQSEIKKVMLDSSLYVMTSLTESFGLVLIEANSYGIPCIAFDSASGAKQIIENKELLISNRDKEKMSKLIVKLLKDKDKLQAYGKEAYNNCQKYLLVNVKKKWLDLLSNNK